MISHSSGANASACSPPSYLSRQQAIPQQPQPMSFEGRGCLTNATVLRVAWLIALAPAWRALSSNRGCAAAHLSTCEAARPPWGAGHLSTEARQARRELILELVELVAALHHRHCDSRCGRSTVVANSKPEKRP